MISEADFPNHVRIESGRFRDAEVNLYAIVRDEMFFLDAFLAHYRQLGVEQFLFLDDSSADGTREFLSDQADCLVLTSDLGFGDQVAAGNGNGRVRTTRAGTLLKRIIPQKYLKNKYALYVDADEFLILPEGLGDLRTVIAILEKNRIACVAASLVDFYPQRLTDLDHPVRAKSFSDLLDRYPFFDATPLVELVQGDFPKSLGEGASKRLFREHGIKDFPPALLDLPSAVARFLPFFATPRSAWLKTPLIKWDEHTWLDGSHNANVPPSPRVLLSMIHFKFTFDLKRRTAQALDRKSHSRGGRKYLHYQQLMEAMRRRGSNFIGSETARYSSPADLAAHGLLKWDLARR
jgi:Glycosyl transferase family 2